MAAGNPPEYNKSVRDFDVVTLDRIKKIDVDVNYDVWKEIRISGRYPSGGPCISGDPQQSFVEKLFEGMDEDTRKALQKGMAHMEANTEKMLEEKN